MAFSVLVVGSGPLSEAVNSTPLARADLKRHRAESAAAAVAAAPKVSPRLILIDRDLSGASELIRTLRKTPPTVSASIVVVADGDFATSELEMLEHGANAVLRFPPGPDWEARLGRLMAVPARKQVRVKADFEFSGEFGEERVAGRLINLSRTGMLIQCDRPAVVGEPFGFKLEIGYDDVIQGRARLVRIAGERQYGCEFVEIDAWAQRRIEIYVEGA